MSVNKFNLVKQLTLLLLMAFAIPQTHAQRVTNSRELGKSLSMRASDELRITSKHSNVNIRHWDRGLAKVEVRMEATGKNERDVNRLLEAIHFQMNETAEGITVEAWMGPFEKMNSWNNRAEFILKDGTKIKDILEHELEVNIYMPHESILFVDHAFGNLEIKDLHQGDMRIYSRHGNVSMGNACCPAVISIKHGNLDMGDANELDLDLRHGNAIIGDIEEFDLEIRHSNLEVGHVDELDTEIGHSMIEINEIHRLRVENNHSQIKIGRIVEYLEAVLNHGNIEISDLSDDFQYINADVNHCELHIKTNGVGYNFNYKGHHGNYELKNGFRYDHQYSDEHGHYKEVKGHRGSGGGTIKVDLNHGSVVVE